MKKKLLIKYTSRQRVYNFFRGLDSIVKNIINKEDYFILCTFDHDDEGYHHPAFLEQLRSYSNLSYHYGNITNKVAAINRDMEFAPQWDILLCMSDDMIITKLGFDNEIRFFMPDDLDAVLHFQDINNGNKLMTMSIIGNTYYNRFGWIYNPVYKSTFCDLEYQEVAKRLGKYIYIAKVIFLHLHPIFKSAPMDDLYDKCYQYDAADRATYFKRAAENFRIAFR